MAYNPNNTETIQEIFSLEGDALARSGFVQPADTRVFGDDARSKAELPIGVGKIVDSGMSSATIVAYKAWEASGSDELF